MPINNIDGLTNLLYNNKITSEDYARLLFLYENHFNHYTVKDGSAEDYDEGESYIYFYYDDFLREWQGTFQGELLENCIILLAKLDIQTVVIITYGKCSEVTREFLEWFFKFFYYQNNNQYGFYNDPEVLKPVFESKFVPYKFDYSEICYDTEFFVLFDVVEN